MAKVKLTYSGQRFSRLEIAAQVWHRYSHSTGGPVGPYAVTHHNCGTWNLKGLSDPGRRNLDPLSKFAFSEGIWRQSLFMAKGEKEKFRHPQEDRTSTLSSQNKMFSQPRLIWLNKSHFPISLGSQRTLMTHRNCSREWSELSPVSDILRDKNTKLSRIQFTKDQTCIPWTFPLILTL